MLNTETLRHPQLSSAQKVLVTSLVLLIASSVFGGPLGVVSRGERHLLLLAIVASAGWSLWSGWGCASRDLLKRHRVILAPAVFFAVNLLWVWPFGGHTSEQLRYALMDMQALVLLPVTVLVFLAMREHSADFHRVIRLTLFMCALLALAQAAIWFFLRFNSLPNDLIYDYVEIYFGTRESVTILEQPSHHGSYLRVVWISSYWLLFAVFLAPLFIRGRVGLFLMQVALGLAIIASYTRGIWLGLIIGVFALVMFIKAPARASWGPVDMSPWRSSLLGLVFAVMLVLLVDWVQGNSALLLSRLYIDQPTATIKIKDESAIKIKDESAIERKVQTRKLLEKWQERPVLGHGYGAYVKDHFSLKERPFLYEMVPFALLMKLGAVGFGLYLSFLVFVLFRLWRLTTHFGSAVALLAGFIAYLIQVHTNPVFFSFTGMLIFSILLYFWLILEVSEKPAPLQSYA